MQDPRQLLEDGIRNQVVKQIASALNSILVFPAGSSSLSPCSCSFFGRLFFPFNVRDNHNGPTSLQVEVACYGTVPSFEKHSTNAEESFLSITDLVLISGGKTCSFEDTLQELFATLKSQQKSMEYFQVREIRFPAVHQYITRDRAEE